MYSKFIAIMNILFFINCMISHLRDIYLSEHFNHRVLDMFSKYIYTVVIFIYRTITAQLIISLVLFLYLPTRSTHNNNHINYIFQRCCNTTSNTYDNNSNSNFCGLYRQPYECDDYDIFYEYFCQKIRYRIYIMIICSLISLISNVYIYITIYSIFYIIS